MMAVEVPERSLDRQGYWLRLGCLYAGAFFTGMALYDIPDVEFQAVQMLLNLIGWALGVYWGVARCRDIGWNPYWAILNWSIIANIIFGVPKSKDLTIVEVLEHE